jgi:hypothetical protein
MHASVIVDVHELHCPRSEKAWGIFANQSKHGAIVIRVGMNIVYVFFDAI